MARHQIDYDYDELLWNYQNLKPVITLSLQTCYRHQGESAVTEEHTICHNASNEFHYKYPL